jgi:hypothetical protein
MPLYYIFEHVIFYYYTWDCKERIMDQVTFKIDVRLLKLLSQNYRSTEKAIKELVDNAWDADANLVSISLPMPMTNEPIIIEDDGRGMSREELKSEYLNIASSRRMRHGDFSIAKMRKVKGSKGIGKFAGFMLATTMKIETWVMGVRYELQFSTSVLDHYPDLHEVPINVLAIEDKSKKCGTRITLIDLCRHIGFPSPESLRQLLIQEYGRETDFSLLINGKKLDVDDIQGVFFEQEIDIPAVGKIRLRFTISDQKGSLRKPGIIMRVGGKVVGDPSFLGLDKSEDFPPKLLKKCFGEIEADGLLDDITADWGAIFENSEKYRVVEHAVQPILREKFKEVYGQEIHLALARIKKKMDLRLASFPEFKRQYAEKAIYKVLERYYQEPESKIEPIVNVLLDAIEFSDYRVVLEHINKAKDSDVKIFAEALDEFGLLEMVRMREQARNRLEFLDYLERLCNTSETLEQDVHKAIEHNLWIFGPNYSLFSSNTSLKKQVEKMLNQKYSGLSDKKRPDLMLSEHLNGDYLLIEFKKPVHLLTYRDYQQVTGYRNDYRNYTGKANITIYLVGGKKGNDLPSSDKEPTVNIVLFNDLISTARRQFEWLLKDLQYS